MAQKGKVDTYTAMVAVGNMQVGGWICGGSHKAGRHGKEMGDGGRTWTAGRRAITHRGSQKYIGGVQVHAT